MSEWKETYAELLATKSIPFIAFDVETANNSSSSVCQIAIACPIGGEIKALSWRVKPPTSNFTNTDIHHITWDDVKDCVGFSELWDKTILPLLNTTVFAAHNANFDMKAIYNSYAATANGKSLRHLNNITVRDSCILAKQYLPLLENHKLPTVCQSMGIALNHHDALSDALACAQITNTLMQRYPEYQKYDMTFQSARDDFRYKKKFFAANDFAKAARKKQAENTSNILKLVVLLVSLAVIFATKAAS